MREHEIAQGRGAQQRGRGARWTALAAGAWLGVAGAGGAAAQEPARCGQNSTDQSLELLVLTTNQRLLCLLDSQIDQPREIGRLGGLTGDEVVIGIDFRPSNGQLFGLGSQGGIYRIDPATAVAQRVSALRMPGSDAPLDISLLGTSFGVDFDPVADRLRIVSDLGRNLLVNPEDGSTAMQADLTPGTGTGITAIAHTHGDADAATGSLLYGFDTRDDALVVLAPAAGGVLAPLRALGNDLLSTAALDIYSQLEEGTTVRMAALGAVAVEGETVLIDVDLTTGLIAELGAFAPGQRVVGLAIPPQQDGMMRPDDPPPPPPASAAGAGAAAAEPRAGAAARERWRARRARAARGAAR